MRISPNFRAAAGIAIHKISDDSTGSLIHSISEAVEVAGWLLSDG
jgi:hypothetical protein